MAAPTYNNSGTYNAGLASVHDIQSVTIPSLTNGYLVVEVGGAVSGTTCSSVTWDTSDNLVALTSKYEDTGSSRWRQLWGIKAPHAATGTIQITYNQSEYGRAGWSIYEGVDQTTPTTGATGNNGTGGSPVTATVNVTAVSDDLVLAVYYSAPSDSTWAPTGSQTERYEVDGHALHTLVATGSSTTMAAQTSNTAWVEAAVALKQVGGGGGGETGFMWL